MEERRHLPPKGHTLAIRDGEFGWLPPGVVNKAVPVTILTPEQQERIKKIQWAFKNVDDLPLSTWLYNFSCDQHPEREITLHERLLPIFREEVRKRNCNRKEQIMLYKAMLACTVFRIPAELIASRPIFQGFAGLADLMVRVHQEDGFRPFVLIKKDEGESPVTPPAPVKDGNHKTKIK